MLWKYGYFMICWELGRWDRFAVMYNMSHILLALHPHIDMTFTKTRCSYIGCLNSVPNADMVSRRELRYQNFVDVACGWSLTKAKVGE